MPMPTHHPATPLKPPYTTHHHFPSPTIPRRRTSPSSSPPPHSPSTVKLKTLIHDLVLPRISRFLRALSKLKSAMSRVFRETDHFLHYLWDSDLALDVIKTKRNRKSSMKYRNKVLFGSFRLHYNWCSSSHVRPIDFSTATTTTSSSIRYSSSSYSTTPAEVENQKNPAPTVTGKIGSFHSSSGQIYYDSTWNSLFSTDDYGYFDYEGSEYHQNDKRECGGDVINRNRTLPADNREFESPYAQQLSSYLQWLEEKGQQNTNSGGDDDEITMMSEIDKLADKFIASCHEKFRLEKIESYRRYQEMLARSM